MRTTQQRINPRILIAAMAVLAGAARAEPTLSDLWKQSVQAETGGDYALALERHEALLPMAGKSYEAHLRAGWLYYQNTRYSKALDHYEKAAGLSSGALAPLYGVMNCRLALGDQSRAAKVAKSILSIDEQNYTANLQLAWLAYQDGNFSLAAAYYRKLNRLYPEDLAVASGLAWSYVEQGWTKQAGPVFEKILLVSPEYPLAEKGREICTSK